MASQLPLWYGRPRGTMANLAVVDGIDFDSAGEYPRTREREPSVLSSILNDGIASFVGFVAPLATFGIFATATNAPERVLFVLLAAIWAFVCISAAYLVHTEEGGAPSWAHAFMAVLPIWGRVAAVALIIAAIVTILFMRIVAAMLEAAARSA